MSYRLRLLVAGVGLCLALLLTGCGDESDDSSASEASSEQKSGQGSSQTATVSQPDTLTPFNVLSVYQGTYDNAPALQINFSRPIKRDQDLEQLIQISLNNTPQDGGWVISDDNRRIYYPYIEPEQVYEVTFSSDLMADNGRSLGGSFKKQVKTSAIERQLRFLSQGS
ncbi:MAG: hypothetical protein OQJ95_09175, partial [Kangiella sp.]|nr:hypothetical protein [Kangiella sp.]